MPSAWAQQPAHTSPRSPSPGVFKAGAVYLQQGQDITTPHGGFAARTQSQKSQQGPWSALRIFAALQQAGRYPSCATLPTQGSILSFLSPTSILLTHRVPLLFWAQSQMDLWAGKECWNTCSSLGHLREKTFVPSAFPTWTHRALQHPLCVRAEVQFKSSDWCRFCCLLFTSAVRVKALVQAAQEAWERLMSLMSSWSSQTVSDLVVCLRSLVHNSAISFHGFTASEDLSAYQCLPPA